MTQKLTFHFATFLEVNNCWKATMVFTKFFEESAKTRNLRSTPAEQTTNWRKSRCNHSQKFVDGSDATFGRSRTESSFGKRKSHSRPSFSHEESPTMKRMRPSKTSKRSQPSAEALALSQKLKELSRQKKLDVALKLFWDTSNDSIRDGHHACIVVDCCSRCGQVSVSLSFTNLPNRAMKYTYIRSYTIELTFPFHFAS